jgi:hypothetical protein
VLLPCCAHFLALRNAFSARRYLHSSANGETLKCILFSPYFISQRKRMRVGDGAIFKCDQDDKAVGKSLIQCSSGNRTSWFGASSWLI